MIASVKAADLPDADAPCTHPVRVVAQPDVCAHCGAWLEDGIWMGDFGPAPAARVGGAIRANPKGNTRRPTGDR